MNNSSIESNIESLWATVQDLQQQLDKIHDLLPSTALANADAQPTAAPAADLERPLRIVELNPLDVMEMEEQAGIDAADEEREAFISEEMANDADAGGDPATARAYAERAWERAKLDNADAYLLSAQIAGKGVAE